MNIMSFILVLTVFWVFFIFIFLPIGIKTHKNPVIGHADSAPINPNLGLKMVISFIISIVLTIIYWYIVTKFPHSLDFIKGLQ